MISERSCDTEDWSNDAKNFALPSQEYIAFKLQELENRPITICNNNCFLNVQINVASEHTRDLYLLQVVVKHSKRQF